jgi:hypothetical protein
MFVKEPARVTGVTGEDGTARTLPAGNTPGPTLAPVTRPAVVRGEIP